MPSGYSGRSPDALLQGFVEPGFQIPLTFPFEQTTVEAIEWDIDNRSSLEHFPNTIMSLKPSDFLQPYLFTESQLSSETVSKLVPHALSTEPPSRDSSGLLPSAADDNDSLGLQTPSKSALRHNSDIQLRSASRKPKNRKHRRPDSSSSQTQARKAHNLVEKQYRTRLKAQFEDLLTVLPTAQRCDHADKDGITSNPGQYLSRGQVLDAARERVLNLEKEVEVLTMERNQLRKDMARIELTLFG